MSEVKDPVLQAKEKKSVLYDFYESIKKGGEILSVEDLEVAIESLKYAQLDIKEQELRRQQEREAEFLKQKMAEEEERRKQAEQRAARRAEREHREHVKKVTAMDLPMDFENSFRDDYRANVHYDNVNDALLVCIDALGMVDIEFIASITGEEMKTVIEVLRGRIYQNPLHWNECFYKGWETAEEYLSGNLLHKYHVATEANKQYLGYFDANVTALESVMQPDIPIEDIYITLGSPWVPTDVIDDFILHLVGLDKYKNGAYPREAETFLGEEYAVRHDDYTGLWEIPQKTRFRTSKDHGKYEHLNYSVWGTSRMDMLYLMEHILNMKTLAIYDTPDPSKKTRILNSTETVKILEKQDAMIAEFRHWVWADEDRAKRLQQSYCRRFGNIRRRVFDGSYFEFPDMNPEIKLRDHQKNSVARIVLSQNTLLAHDVGAGKTFTMIAAGMELRRLGKSKKNMYVIPNGIMAQWRSMFKLLYPNANILVVDRKNFTFKKRYATLQRIMNEDFDAILITYSCFDMLSLSKRYYQDLYTKRLAMLDKANSTFYSKGTLQRKRMSVLKVLEKLQEDMSENVCDVPFDELGINTLFVDEAHNYKNVTLHTGITRVRGLSDNGSKKCDGMMDKVHCVQRQNNGGRVIMATGTPITNSITDLFILQKYLQEGELEFLGICNFDEWVGMFGKKVSEFEIDVDTNNYHLATRFAKFCNVPELTAILSNVSDFYRVDGSMGLPDFDGYSDVICRGSDDFKDYLRDISKRADDVRKKRVNKKQDNLLKITTDGRKAALDMRLIDFAYGLDEESKVYRCAEKIADIYAKTRENKNIQMVFCDSSTPKMGFNLYDELRDLLSAMGVPRNEIAFIHDADSDDKKRLLFHDLQEGNVSVVIGSTFKMGLGVNVQKRLCALHHLDVPWKPADMVQREGRILRQGNECEAVELFRYVTKGSFDAYSWQLLEKKQTFISQILAGCIYDREGDDVDEAVLNYAEVKALAVGNPLIKRRVEIANEIDKYRILRRDFLEERKKQEKELSELPEKIRQQQKRIEGVEGDMAYYAAHKIDYTKLKYAEQKEIRDLIYTAVKTKVNQPFETKVLTYQGFDVVVPARMIPKMPTQKEGAAAREPIPYVFVKREAVYYVEIESHAGITKRLNNLLENLQHEKERREEHLQSLFYRKKALEEELKKTGNTYVEEIEGLQEELQKIEESLGLTA
ncbi:MAG: hypothetical protein E7624_02725 [Ruminococcaceae bacterium]|nr:hypothetical protein [Oscillospiraceae bacterium]